MEWDIFWNAFGAIGTTIGSLVTAVAVVIAVIQYKQPLVKKLQISFGTAFPVYDTHLGESFYSITIANTGVRQIIITNVYLSTGKKNLLLNKLFTDLDPSHRGSDFPKTLQPEESFVVYLSYIELAKAFSNLLAQNVITGTQKIKILVTDTTSGSHLKKTGLTASRIAIDCK